MKINEILTEQREVGRDLAHLEDLIFISGSQGGLEAVNILRSIDNGTEDVTVKWDGSPAVWFGRDENGRFVLTDKYGFTAKKYDGKAKSPQHLKDMILNRNMDIDQIRLNYANTMAKMWSIFEKATPENFRGFFYGDLLYTQTPAIRGNMFVFQPNQVRYAIPVNTTLGQQISNSSAGVVVHYYQDLDGYRKFVDANVLDSGELFVMPPIFIKTPISLDFIKLDKLANYISHYADRIDALLEPRPGLSDMKKIVYSYVNNTSANENWNNLITGFENWLKTSKVSKTKQSKILAMPELSDLTLIFTILLHLQNLKNQAIIQLDQTNNQFMSTIDGKLGGEGYVINKRNVKLVPRHHFKIGK